MDMERLIEEVRKFPVLYNQADEKYRNSEYKDRVWKKIATSLEAKGGIDECKKRWASIRDQLRKTLQKRKTVTGQAAVRHRKYKFEDCLAFLLPHMIERETISNVSLSEEGDEESDEIDSIRVIQEQDVIVEGQVRREEEPNMEIRESQTESVGNTSQRSQASSAGSPASSMKKGRFVRPVPLKRQVHRETTPQESPSSQLMAYILAEKEAERTNKPAVEEKHPVDAFLAGIAPTLKSLNPILLHQAKSSIFSVVQKFEMEQLMSYQGQYMGQAIPSNLSTFPPALSSSSRSISASYTSSCPESTYHQLQNQHESSRQDDPRESVGFPEHDFTKSSEHF